MSTDGRNHRPATYEDLLDLPENVVGEIIDGELFASPRPAIPHAGASSALGGALMPPFQFGDGGPGGWWIFDEPELHLGENVLVPDLAGWRHERMPEAPKSAYIELPPDWICEVVSPSTANLDRARKMAKYAYAGVGHAWLVDPLARTLEVFRLESGHWLLLGTWADDAIVRAEPFDAVGVDLLRLWGERRGG